MLPSLANPVLQSGSSRQNSNPFRWIFECNGSLALGQCEVRSWQLCAVLPLLEEPVSASLANLCLVVFCGWEGECLPLTHERRGNLRHVNKQKVSISYTRVTWNYAVGKQAGHLGQWFYLVLHKEFIWSEIILNFHLEASLNMKHFSQRWKTGQV